MRKRFNLSVLSLIMVVSMLFIFSACEINDRPIVGPSNSQGSSDSVITSGSESTSQTQGSYNSTSNSQVGNSSVSTESKSNSSSAQTSNSSSETADLNDKKAIVICIDYSTGMIGQKPAGPNKFSYVQKSIMNALYKGAFGTDTQIGIIFFGGKISSSHPNPVVALNLTNSSKVGDIETALNTKPNDKGYMGNTEWRLPMETAAEMLKTSSASTKHIIFITDGSENSGGDGETSKIVNYPDGGWKKYNEKQQDPVLDPNKTYPAYLKDNYGITMTSVASLVQQSTEYDSQVANIKAMSDYVTGGAGNFYEITDPELMLTVIEEECKNMPIKGQTACNHEWSEPQISQNGNCPANQIIKKECKKCGVAKTENVYSKDNHNLIHRDAKPATCQEVGWSAYEACSNCDYKENYVEENKKEHNYVDCYCSMCGIGEKITILVPDAPSDATIEVMGYLLYLRVVNNEEVNNYTTYLEYLNEVARLLDQCDTQYNKLTAAEKAMSEVVQAKSNGDQAKVVVQERKDKVLAAMFDEIYAELAKVPVLKNENVANVFSLNDLITTNDTKFAVRVADYTTKKAKVAEWMAYIKQHTVEQTYIAQDGNGNGILEDTVTTTSGKTYSETGANGVPVKKRGREFEPVANFFNITDNISGGSQDSCHVYSDAKNNNVKIWQFTTLTSISFTAEHNGTLTVYVRPQNARTYIITSGENSQEFTSGNTAESSVFEVELTSGNVSISTNGGTGYVCAVKYVYYDLP